MRKTIIPLALAAAAVAAAPAAAAPATATFAVAAAPAAAAPATAAAATQFEGKVVSVNRDNRSFRLRDSERGTFKFRVRRGTDFERIAGFGALHAGMRGIEVTARRSDGRWIATVVERSGGGGHHGGDDD